MTAIKQFKTVIIFIYEVCNHQKANYNLNHKLKCLKAKVVLLYLCKNKTQIIKFIQEILFRQAHAPLCQTLHNVLAFQSTIKLCSIVL